MERSEIESLTTVSSMEHSGHRIFDHGVVDGTFLASIFDHGVIDGTFLASIFDHGVAMERSGIESLTTVSRRNVLQSNP